MIITPTLRHLDALCLRGRQGLRILDIGTQNAAQIEASDIAAFLRRYPNDRPDGEIDGLAARLAEKSVIKAGHETLYLSEILAHTSLSYDSVDVAPGRKTTILDLNIDHPPKNFISQFDIILNLGTTEHILNQINCFKFMHDCLDIDGYIYHQVPLHGWVRHGYFSYHENFFIDLAHSNQYEITDIFITESIGEAVKDISPIRNPYDYSADAQSTLDYSAPGLLGRMMNAIFKKKREEPFRLPLEVATTHAPVDARIADQYKGGRRVTENPALGEYGVERGAGGEA